MTVANPIVVQVFGEGEGHTDGFGLFQENGVEVPLEAAAVEGGTKVQLPAGRYTVRQINEGGVATEKVLHVIEVN